MATMLSRNLHAEDTCVTRMFLWRFTIEISGLLRADWHVFLRAWHLSHRNTTADSIAKSQCAIGGRSRERGTWVASSIRPSSIGSCRLSLNTLNGKGPSVTKFMKVALLGLGLLAILGALPAISQDQTSQTNGEKKDDAKQVPEVTEERPMSFWMAKKLDHSKAILESLTKGDFEDLVENAEQMQRLGKLEGFVRRKNRDYQSQLRTFAFANQELIRQAKRKNPEGAVLAFNQLSTSCVACHVLLREGVD
jgi:hypothetical protein